MTLLSREAILGASQSKTEDVDVAEWGGAVRIAVMSGAARDAFTERQASEKQPYSVFQARLIVATAVDEHGQALFTEADIEALRGKHISVLDRLVAVALRVNGMQAGAVEAAEKNSAAAPSGASGSGLPPISANP